ncbi:MAG: hypothetical protein CO170_00955 [candidate division SR1 bacterium CG_4_9_14_3_um_filter_40_9]|nr:MAG: hypothetical protein CO170_00955 [candidate division SR1 bacterium CG_4_9_14_3_um_filter_40_9]
MLEKIKTKLFEKYKKEESKGLFFSLFDKDGNVLTSTGVLQTDKNMGDLVEIISAGILDKEKGAVSVAVDVVTEVTQESDIQKLMAISTKDYGVFLINPDASGQKSGIILPNMKGVNDVKTALGLIKQKYQISGNVLIYVFKTERMAFGL